MTLGSDLADTSNPAPLAFAAGVMGVVGLIGAGLLVRYVPRYEVRSRRS